MYQRCTRWARPVAVAFFVGLLAACGGGGGGSGGGGEGGGGGAVSGRVTDPGIAGALVKLQNANGNALAVPVRSDADGGFRFAVSSGANLTGARVVAQGGVDSQTGQDFTGLTLVGPVSGGSGLATPVSTLVMALVDDGADLGDARQTVAGWLGLDADRVLDDPATDGDLQRQSLRLTLLGVALNRESAPMTWLVDALRDTGDLDAAREWLATDPNLTEASRQRVNGLAQEFQAVAGAATGQGAEAVVDAANRIAVRRGIALYLRDAFGQNAEDETSQTNIAALADTLISANGGAGVPAGSAQIRNLMRYVLQNYQLDPDALSHSDFTVPAGLGADNDIARLTGLRALDHRIPLTDAEKLGMDSDARREYFYASDLSPFYRAERLFDDVLDDLILDPVYQEIAEGLASAGRTDDSMMILRTKIFQPYQRADTMQSIAFQLIQQGRFEIAQSLLESARSDLDEIVAQKGLENLTFDDAGLYYRISREYTSMGNADGAKDSLENVYAYVDSYQNSQFSSVYARLLSAIRNSAESATEEAVAMELSEPFRSRAINLTDLFTDFVLGVGYQTSGSCTHYKVRTLYLTYSADFYQALRAEEKLKNVIDLFEQTRSITPCNVEETEAYLRRMAPYYIGTGQVERYKEQAETTVFSNDAKEKTQSAIVVGVAYQAVLDGNLADALQNLREQYDTPGEYLANLLKSKGSPGRLAEALYDNGYIAYGDQVRDAAWNYYLSDEYQQFHAGDRGALLSGGCLRLVEFADERGDPAQATDWMPTCAQIADQLLQSETDPGDRFDILYQIADYQNTLDLKDAAAGTIARAESEAGGMQDDEYDGALRNLISLALGNDNLSLALDYGREAQTRYFQDAAGATNDSTRSAAMSGGLSLATSLNQVAEQAGRMALRTGALTVTDQQNVADARAAARDLILGNGNQLGVANLADAQLSDSSRLTYLNQSAQVLAKARHYDEAVALTGKDGLSNNDRNQMLQSIATVMTGENDFAKGAIAVRDTDGDGRPDFFNLGVDAEDIAASALQLDDDLDGDGITDDEDSTPFCASCDG
ncbi:carboxypeptidase-like regulatory domain-containing protein [Alcanivorax marinus]|uniref:Carboxypeptidase-like regulatory domain-containing protein n=1 Tax=Alloalcanivorax marinus TaxID=1177169 RepID=A0A9Q3URP2_9GAMM|nr:carboxypeptidase-like regulatory domain-containing protein [Alloalcanivorax marinus]MCC4309808.1 carboxypeptidase-like regulatory domain-containing protein [Alloalcanivorax marinus]